VKTGLENLVTNVDKTDTLSRMAAELSLEQIRSSIEAVTGASEQLKLNANPRLALEVLMLSMPEAHA
jgi:DNA polymerase-3 subunit delta'